MASEAAILGTPAIYLDNTGRFYTDELEKKYGMVYNFTESPIDQNRSINKGIEILKKDYKNERERKRAKILNDKIDVTEFLAWFVQNYPESMQIMKNNPGYQLRFK